VLAHSNANGEGMKHEHATLANVHQLETVLNHHERISHDTSSSSTHAASSRTGAIKRMAAEATLMGR